MKYTNTPVIQGQHFSKIEKKSFAAACVYPLES